MPLTEQQKRDDRRAKIVAHKRAMKAIHIADALGRAGRDAASARRLDPDGRRNAEREAMVRPASQETWDVVFVVMDLRERSSKEDAEAHERELLDAR